MNILHATIVKGIGTDKVMLKTDLPSAIYPFDEGTLFLTFDTAKNTGAAYTRDYFNLTEAQITIIERPKPSPPYNIKTDKEQD